MKTALVFGLLQLLISADAEPRWEEQTFRVNLRYSDAPRALDSLEVIIDVLPPMAYVVRDAEGLEDVIRRRYGVVRSGGTASDLPLLHELLERRIVERSGLGARTQLVPGDTLWLPALPRRAAASGGGTDHAPPLILHVKVRPREGVEPSCELFMERFEAVLEDELAHDDADEDYVVADLRVVAQPRDMACLRERMMRTPNIADLALGVALAGIQVQLEPVGSDAGAFPSFVPRGELRDSLTSAVKARNGRPVTLYILDTGWPDSAQRVYSITHLFRLVAGLNTNYRLGISTSEFRYSARFQRPVHDHVVNVQRAIAPLDSLDTLDRVRVVYVPLTRDQNAGPILTLLYQAYYRLVYKFRVDGDDPASVPINSARARLLDEDARQAVVRLPLAQTGNAINTDASLFDMLRFLAMLAAQDSKRPFVLNLSWTLPEFRMQITNWGNADGLTVVAAGNDNRNILVKPRVDFAWRGYGGQQFLAVMNSDQTRPRCLSSTFWSHDKPIDPDVADGMFGVAFNGMVAPGLCGTSFAAPRVAWLIAAAEVPRTANIATWRSRLSRDILDMGRRRDGTREFYFDPLAFLRKRGTS